MFQLVNGFNDMMDNLVIHRDLKLQNIMLHFPDLTPKILNMNRDQKRQFLKEVDLTTMNFEVKIADFGFSKKLKNKGQINKTICGTPLYMAPQVVQKTQYSYKSDIWSIGCILFELLNGLTPFHSRNRQEFEGKVQ
jgi:serine/threonine protein kinase